VNRTGPDAGPTGILLGHRLLTFRTMSDWVQMSSGCSMILAPVAMKSTSGMAEPPGPVFDIHRVTGRGELAYPGRGDAPVLVDLDLFGHSDDHRASSIADLGISDGLLLEEVTLGGGPGQNDRGTPRARVMMSALAPLQPAVTITMTPTVRSVAPPRRGSKIPVKKKLVRWNATSAV